MKEDDLGRGCVTHGKVGKTVFLAENVEGKRPISSRLRGIYIYEYIHEANMKVILKQQNETA
jgi:hypothetical protein